MERSFFWIFVLSLIGASLAAYKDCESPPHVQHASIRMEENDEDSVRALYTCDNGYKLIGRSDLICDLNTDEWNADPPSCISRDDISNEVKQQPRGDKVVTAERKPQDIAEYSSLPSQFSHSVDMSCVQAKVKAPEIRHGYVQKYDRRRKDDRIFLVAFYVCNNNFDFEDVDINALFCSERKWVGELPVCAPLGEYGEDEEEDEEEYEEYDPLDGNGEDEDRYNEQTDDDIEMYGKDDAVDGSHHSVSTEPSPPSHPVEQENQKELEDDQNQFNEIPTRSEYQPTEYGGATEKTVLEVTMIYGEDVNKVTGLLEPTQDLYEPRVLDSDCGPDKGGCEQKCERVLFPGENEPRLKCSCFQGFSLDPYDYARCHDIDECEMNNGGCEQICNNIPGSFECACEQGLRIDTTTGTACVDINECLLRNGHGPCQGTCQNMSPGYRCSCESLPGTELAPNNHTCEDAGECSLSNGGCSYICLPTSIGRVFCLCPIGLEISSDGKNCRGLYVHELATVAYARDINECELPEVKESCLGVCENTHGSYRCEPALNTRDDTSPANENQSTEYNEIYVAGANGGISCPEGYQASHDNLQCMDIDECREGTSGCQHCRNLEGSYECTCPPGYELAVDTRTCIDINECESNNMCSHNCENTPGSYICTCDENHHLLEDSHTCAPDSCNDLNNPQLSKPRCAYQCMDLPSGFYECVCPQGYGLSEDLHNCIVIENMCTIKKGYELCTPGTCISNEDNTDFSCSCPMGYSSDGHSCQDIDECAVGSNECSHDCINTAGSYRCSCPSGLQFADSSEHQCEDIDECKSNPGICGSLICHNQPESFICLCPDGSEPNAETGICGVVDPCTTISCSHGCVTEGSEGKCVCPEDMVLQSDGLSCAFVDPCLVDNNGCQHICNSENSGSCTCRIGFNLGPDGKSCIDIDECQLGNGGCHHICKNIEGGYQCACQPGFEFLDEQLKNYCFDVDECAKGLHNCGEGLSCENLNGSFTCQCPRGYSLGQPNFYSSNSFNSSSSAYTEPFLSPSLSLYTMPATATESPAVMINTELACLDIDECSMSNGKCSHICMNFPGTFKCFCPNGFALSPLDNSTCIAVDHCSHGNGGCSRECQSVHGQVNCFCPAGYQLAMDGRTCEDINECAGDSARCAHNCINTYGGFSCSCHEGFALAVDQMGCEDIDECMETNGNCSFICINLLGTYACACDSGFELSDDQRTCLDINECALGHDDCQHGCVNIDGGYECTCPNGYMLEDSKTSCVDINECDLLQHSCSHLCINELGSYKCACPIGFVLASDNKTCVTEHIPSCRPGFVLSPDGVRCVSQCTMFNGGCSHLCSESLGCQCPSGYRLGEDLKTCEDIDECAESSVCEYQCKNIKGSYECICPAGYHLRNGRECEDINECLTDNGGCINGECVNYNGSFQCKCPAGHRLADDRRTCKRRTDFHDHCAPFIAPVNGEIHCTKFRHKKKLFYNTKCKVSCRHGYRLEGPSHRQCNASGSWGNIENKCVHLEGWSTLNKPTSSISFITPPKYHMTLPKPIAMPSAREFNLKSEYPLRPRPKFSFANGFGIGVVQPYIKCPRNTTLFLLNGEQTVFVTLQKPLTNLDYRYIESTPDWTKTLQGHLAEGVHVITFRGQDPVTGNRAQCETVIKVRRAIPPQVAFCTPSLEVTLSPNQVYRSVSWEEPRFEVASGGLKKYKSRIPGELFGAGVHTVYYEATSDEGLSSRCEFKIHVKEQNVAENVQPIVMRSSPILHMSMTNANPLMGHDAYVICPGQNPIKIQPHAQPVDLPVGCILKNVRRHPMRQHSRKQLLSSFWTSL